MPYEFLTSHGILSEKHRSELKSKRGFTDATIDHFRFFSGGEYLASLETDLLKTFSRENLCQAGILTQSGEKFSISKQLLDDRIMIPYLDFARKAVLVRPHKMGLSGVPIRP